MKNKEFMGWLLAVTLAVGFGCTMAQAEQHRATHLGNPVTRFASPLQAPDDLRARFNDPSLKPDFISVLKQWGWPGKMEDIFHAAQTAEIREISIPAGTVLPFMSSRENGDPICLRNVTWAGKEPISAYAFDFSSNGHRYRCVTPKPCSNFLVEDLGSETKPSLALECNVPERVPTSRPVKIYLTVHNTGDGAEPQPIVTFVIPAGAIVTNATDGGLISATSVTWKLPNLPAGASQKVCASLLSPKAGTLPFHSLASGTANETAQSDCETLMFKVNAILVELVDLADPIEVGKNVTYVIKITDQGNNDDTNIRLVCTVPPSQAFVSGTGTTAVHADGRTITMELLPDLTGKAVATWQVVTKALAPDDSRFKVQVTSDQFEQPIHREESTELY